MTLRRTIFIFGCSTLLITTITFLIVSTASAAGLTLLGDSPAAARFYQACTDYSPVVFLLSFGSFFLTAFIVLIEYFSNPDRKPITFNL